MTFDAIATTPDTVAGQALLAVAESEALSAPDGVITVTLSCDASLRVECWPSGVEPSYIYKHGSYAARITRSQAVELLGAEVGTQEGGTG